MKPAFFKSVLTDNLFFGPRSMYSAATLLNIPDELDQSNSVAFAAMAPYLTKGSSVLDVGCGSHFELSKAFIDLGCKYTGFDLNNNSLLSKRFGLNQFDNELNLICGNVLTDLDKFEDDSFDAVLVKSMLLHIPDNQLNNVLNQLFRISKNALFVIENSWSRMGNVSNSREFQKWRNASAKLLASHGKTPELDRIMPRVLTNAFNRTPMEIFRIDDRLEGDYSAEFLPVCETALHCVDYCYDNKDAPQIRTSITNMMDYLKGPNVSFIPPAQVVAHIPKMAN